MQAHLLHAPASHVRGPECARPDAHRAQQQATCLARAPSPAAPITNTPNRRQATPSTRCQAQAGSTVQALVREVEKRKLRPLPKDTENIADDPNLHNPLLRQQRLSTGWMGVVMEYEGVVVEETSEHHHQAWRQLAKEEGKPIPLQFALKRSDGMKAEQIIQEVFCWSRQFAEVRRLAQRKEAIYMELLCQHKPMLSLGVRSLLSALQMHQVPAALAAAEPEARLKTSLQEADLASSFQVVISAEDMSRGRPDPEGYLLAAQQLGRPPMRCVVIGNSNQSVEAARECGMAAVVVAGRRPLFELGAADLVVKQVDELSFQGLKQLFGNEGLVEPQEQMEEEEVALPRYGRY